MNVNEGKIVKREHLQVTCMTDGDVVSSQSTTSQGKTGDLLSNANSKDHDLSLAVIMTSR